MGPGRRGRCPRASACHPVRAGDRWRCNRSTLRGGICEEGPSPEGECCEVYQCTPRRSLRSRRGRFVVGCTLTTLGALCVLFSSDWRNEVLVPGPLSMHHAQLLQRQGADRCASCHAAGNQSLVQWLGHAIDDDLAQPSQTQLCLECHAAQIPHPWATAAHNVDPAELLPSESAAVARQVDPHQVLACAACHREHHGATHDLAWMSDRACQACHKEQYKSFATDHPEFAHWPAKRRTRIAFDHAAHEAKHFPKEKKVFQCATCHLQGPEGAFQQTLGYDATCAACHDRDIASSWETGIALFSLPSLDIQALNAVGHQVGSWPEQASDEFDGALPTITKLLLLADPKGMAAMKTLGADFDFFDVDSDNPEQMQAAADAAGATQALFNDVLENGHAAVRRRIEDLLGRAISTHELGQLMAYLSPEILSGFLDTRRKDAGDEESRTAARQRVEGGGWFREDFTLSIRYRATEHADPWVTAWINVLAEASGGPKSALVQPLLKQALRPTAPGLCGQCHSLDRLPEGRLKVQWHPKQPSEGRSEFTRFSHRPHLVQSELSDCQFCHRMAVDSKVMTSYAEDAPLVFENGFEPITRKDCAECHTQQAAGDSCLQCHRYHLGSH